jgi:CHAD domain-containing protein
MAQVTPGPGVALRILSGALSRASRGEPQAVHAVRVATRRLREALRLMSGSGREGRKLARELRRLTRVLGPIREMDVSRALLRTLATARPDLALACERADTHLVEVVARRRARLAKSLADLDPRSLVARVDAHLRHIGDRANPARQPIDRVRLASRIADRADDVGAAAESAGALYAPEALHTVRIRTKKLRYALEVGRVARLSGAASAATRLRRYQDLLGDLHDLQMLASHVGRLQSRLPLEDADLGALSDLLVHVENRCRELHAGFVGKRAALVALVDQVATAFSRHGRESRHT